MLVNTSKDNYQSIPSSETNSDVSAEGSSFKPKRVIALAILFCAALLFGRNSYQANEAPVKVNWPKYMRKAGLDYNPVKSPMVMPVTTEEAIEMGWVKIEDEPCNEKLGEPWRVNGERSKDSCVTLYFTPQVGDIPGYLSAYEADYYDNVEENLVGSYFKPAEVSKDGTYWSIAVLVREPTELGLCDTSVHVGIQEGPYFAVAPEMVNNVYPKNSNDPEMKERFVEGMCSNGMGFHWFSDVVGGANLTYKPENLVPVTPMYNSVTGDFQNFYFIATDVLKRDWPYEKCGGFGIDSAQCGYSQGIENMWDSVITSMFTKNKAPFFFCSQFCDRNCQFIGGKDFPELGVAPGFMTMHVFFDQDDECGQPEGMKDHPYYPVPIDDFLCRDPETYPVFEDVDGNLIGNF